MFVEVVVRNDATTLHRGNARPALPSAPLQARFGGRPVPPGRHVLNDDLRLLGVAWLTLCSPCNIVLLVICMQSSTGGRGARSAGPSTVQHAIMMPLTHVRTSMFNACLGLNSVVDLPYIVKHV